MKVFPHNIQHFISAEGKYQEGYQPPAKPQIRWHKREPVPEPRYQEGYQPPTTQWSQPRYQEGYQPPQEQQPAPWLEPQQPDVPQEASPVQAPPANAPEHSQDPVEEVPEHYTEDFEAFDKLMAEREAERGVGAADYSDLPPLKRPGELAKNLEKRPRRKNKRKQRRKNRNKEEEREPAEVSACHAIVLV